MPASAQDLFQRKSLTLDKTKSFIKLAFFADFGLGPWKRFAAKNDNGRIPRCNPPERRVGFLGRVPQGTAVKLATPMVNDKGCSHQQLQVPFLGGNEIVQTQAFWRRGCGLEIAIARDR